MDAACRSRRLAILIMKGTIWSGGGASVESKRRRIVAHLLRRLPASNVVCLNLGEFPDVDAAGLERVLPSTFVGNLYYTDPVTGSQRAVKKRIKAILRANRRKWGYRQQLARDDAWALLRGNCLAWFGPSAKGHEAAVKYAGQGLAARSPWGVRSAPTRCRVGCRRRRCAGVSSSTRRRCCLCTRDASGYCRHHRFG